MNHNGGPNSNRTESQGQKDSWNDPNGPIQVLNVRTPRKIEEQVPKMDEAIKEESVVTNETAMSVEAERQKRSRFQKIGHAILKFAAVLGAAAALYSVADKEPSKGLAQEAWKNAIQKEAAGYGADISYGEDVSTVSFVDRRNGKQTYVYLEDIDNDTLFEKGHASNSEGGADISYDGGYTFQGALDQLNSKMNKGD